MSDYVVTTIKRMHYVVKFVESGDTVLMWDDNVDMEIEGQDFGHINGYIMDLIDEGLPYIDIDYIKSIDKDSWHIGRIDDDNFYIDIYVPDRVDLVEGSSSDEEDLAIAGRDGKYKLVISVDLDMYFNWANFMRNIVQG